MDTKDSSGSHDEEASSFIEYGQSELPPLYIDVQGEVEKNLQDANANFLQLKKLHAKRLKISFDMSDRAETELQNSIFDKTREITQLLKTSEKNLKTV